MRSSYLLSECDLPQADAPTSCVPAGGAARRACSADVDQHSHGGHDSAPEASLRRADWTADHDTTLRRIDRCATNRSSVLVDRDVRTWLDELAGLRKLFERGQSCERLRIELEVLCVQAGS